MSVYAIPSAQSVPDLLLTANSAGALTCVLVRTQVPESCKKASEYSGEPKIGDGGRGIGDAEGSLHMVQSRSILISIGMHSGIGENKQNRRLFCGFCRSERSRFIADGILGKCAYMRPRSETDVDGRSLSAVVVIHWWPRTFSLI